MVIATANETCRRRAHHANATRGSSWKSSSTSGSCCSVGCSDEKTTPLLPKQNKKKRSMPLGLAEDDNDGVLPFVDVEASARKMPDSSAVSSAEDSQSNGWMQPVIPVGLWWTLGVHLGSVVLVVLTLYLYYQASLWSCLGFGLLLALPGSCLFVAARNAHLTLHEALMEEGRGRAILDTLYPQTVLKRMYQQVSVEQIAMSNSTTCEDDDSEDDDSSQPGVPQNEDDSSEYYYLDQSSPPVDVEALGYNNDLGEERCSTLLSNTSPIRRRASTSTSPPTPTSPSVGPPSGHGIPLRQNTGHPATTGRTPTRQRSKQHRKLSLTHQVSRTLCRSLSQEMAFLRRNSLTNARRNSLTNTARRNSLTNAAARRRNSLTNSGTRRNSLTASTSSGTSSRRNSLTGAASATMVGRRNSRTGGRNRSNSHSNCSTPTHSFSKKRHQRRSSCSAVPVDAVGLLQQEPIQEHFAAVTILFADIAGFTRWSSQRTPKEVFQLLERIFLSFDTMGREMGVYKIETIGDCYLAVTGIPTFMEDHALVMATFAQECVLEFARICQEELQHCLGADTATLALRAGIHSGPVTAGVLRGEKSRFQLFGDTVNTAARMESNGHPGRVHLSQATADLILPHHPEWITTRPDLVDAKGKGKLQTYWLTMPPPPVEEEEDADLTETSLSAPPSIWIGLSDVLSDLKSSPSGMETAVVDILAQGLKRIQASVQCAGGSGGGSREALSFEPEDSALDEAKQMEERLLPLQSSVQSILEWKSLVDSIELSVQVMAELSHFVQTLCGLFLNNNPYHCLEHACYQLVSVNRILQDVILDASTATAENFAKNVVHAQLANDPLAQWALLLAAFVGDIDHPGVSNAYLIQAEPEMAQYFQNHCLTEQNALDTAWELLLDAKNNNEHLVHTLCPRGRSDLERFRLLLVHAVLSGNIELEEDVFANDQDRRWARLVEACQASPQTLDPSDANLATLVLVEQLMQTASLIPSVQSWELFVKWSERALRESYLAYISGKEEIDPCTGWYDAVRKSLERSTIPLARRLHTRAVYGDAYEGFAKRASRNLRQWEAQGPTIVSEMVTSVKYQYGEK